jgi:hypothetical protein
VSGHRQRCAWQTDALTKRRQNFEAVAVRERKVQQHDIHLLSGSNRDSLGHSRGYEHLVPGAVEQDLQRVGNELAILHEEDGRQGHLVLICVEWERKEEATTFAELAFHPDAPGVQLDELAGDRQPKTRSVVWT